MVGSCDLQGVKSYVLQGVNSCSLGGEVLHPTGSVKGMIKHGYLSWTGLDFRDLRKGGVNLDMRWMGM